MRLHRMLRQHGIRYSVIPLAALLLFLTACGGSDGGGITPTLKDIVSVSPGANSNTAAITTTVSIVFGIDMDKTSVENEFTLNQTGGAAVAGTVVYDVATKTVVLTPAADLSYSTSYTATLSSNVLAADGSNPLTSNYSWSFSTVGPPVTIVSVSPEDGSDTSLATTTVSILFGILMDKASVESASIFTVTETAGSAVTGTVLYTPGTNTAVFTPSADLSSGQQYTATLSSNVEDASNNMPLSSDYVWSFTIAPATVLVSTDANGMVGPTGTASSSSDIDSEGRYIVFVSSEQLTSVSTGTVAQVYRKDTQTGMVRMVSTDDTDQTAANNACSDPVVNSTGRYVAFTSLATNLSSPASGGIEQIYLKDIQTGDIQMVSRASASEAGNDDSVNAAISENGNLVAFESMATNLDGGGGFSNIFLFNTNSGIMERITVPAPAATNPNGNSVIPDISDDGRYVVFVSGATNLIPNDTNGVDDIFVRDRTNSTYTRISQDTGGNDANAASSDPAISGDGSTVVFTSTATDLVAINTGGIANIFVRDFVAATATELVSVTHSGGLADDASGNPSVSFDGRYVAFVSAATDLISGVDGNSVDDVFVRDTQGGNADIVRVSETAAGGQANAASGLSRISDNGRYVSFDSEAALDAADTNGTNIADVYRGHNASYP